MELFDLAVGLGPVRSGLLHGGGRAGAGVVPQSGSVAGPVVGDDSLAGDTDRGVPPSSSGPEPGSGRGLFIGVDLGVDDASAVVDGRVQIHVAGTRVTAVAVLASAVHPPAATVGDGGQFLDVDMDQLTRVFR